ncbi:hypothetical protein, partial [Klebsiella pneumoniae]
QPPRRRAHNPSAKYGRDVFITTLFSGGIMRLFNVIETVLNCLYMALEIWDWLEKHFPVFKAFIRILA